MEPNSQLLMWSIRMTTQAERSRMAERQHVRAEQVRQARSARPAGSSAFGRMWSALTGTTRASVEPTALATQQ